ncbi:hypothetical protein M0R45_019448 [Rubus argutus]|uniref:Uncharacterized protein n=1 Tax=Rubus argutus TaxID=59490 RepID=A0AAW1X7U7_RUBAR
MPEPSSVQYRAIHRNCPAQVSSLLPSTAVSLLRRRFPVSQNRDAINCSCTSHSASEPSSDSQASVAIVQCQRLCLPCLTDV